MHSLQFASFILIQNEQDWEYRVTGVHRGVHMHVHAAQELERTCRPALDLPTRGVSNPLHLNGAPATSTTSLPLTCYWHYQVHMTREYSVNDQ